MTEQVSIRCEGCGLVQFLTARAQCRRCKQPIYLAPKQETAAVVEPEPFKPLGWGWAKRAGGRVRSLRVKRGLSQRGLAALLGIPRTYLTKMENASLRPTLRNLKNVAAALNVGILDLILCDRELCERDILADPFLAELAAAGVNLHQPEWSLVVKEAMRLAENQRRTT